MEVFTAPAPVWLVLAMTFALILNIYDAAAKGGRCHVCGAPANTQRHAAECPWGRP